MQLAVQKPSLALAKASTRRAVRPCARPVVSRRAQVVVRAEESSSGSTSTTDAPSFDSEKVLKDLQAKWDAVENKSAVALYVGGGVVFIWLSNTIVGAINTVPLLPKLMELVGLGYSAWFTYRYLLFKSSREELLQDIGELSKKITGSE